MHARLGLLLVLLAGSASAAPAAGTDGVDAPPISGSKVYLEVSPDGRADLEALFRALEQSLLAGEPQSDPVVIILHGPDALPFIRGNYAKNRAIVDRAAKLEAFQRIDLRMSESWMRENGFDQKDLLPFVSAIPLAPAEVERLEKDGYLRYRRAADRSGLL